jgi:eukaryotic-like serine/threonine-protein kinase
VIQLDSKFKVITPSITGKSKKHGEVSLIEDQSGNVFVAKSLTKLPKNKHEVDRLRNECQFSFETPGLPIIYNWEETDEFLTYYRNYAPGVDLMSFFKQIKKADRFDFTVRFLQKLAPILDTLADLHICHCDLKPSNLIIDGDFNEFNLHLIDFGLAVNYSETTTRKLVFPLGFAAPELILNRLDCVDQTTDLFALGITLYKCFDGKLPHHHNNPSIYTNIQLNYPIPTNGRIPKPLNSAIQRMCTKPYFKTSPNKLNKIEVEQALKKMKNLRFQSVHEIIEVLTTPTITESRSLLKRLIQIFSKA